MKGLLKIIAFTTPVIIILLVITLSWMRHNDQLMIAQQQQFDREFKAVTEHILGDDFKLPEAGNDIRQEQERFTVEQKELEKMLKDFADDTVKLNNRGGGQQHND